MGAGRKVGLVSDPYDRRAMPTRWLAVGAETDLLARARELRRSWERLVGGGALEPGVAPEATAGLRPAILESWRRSSATGLEPTDLLAPIEADQSEARERWLEHPLGTLAHVLADQFEVLAEDSKSLVVVADASGLVLHRIGAEWLKEWAAQMNLVEGARFSEADDGTNGIGTPLAANHAFQVFAFEHFNERHHQTVCSGAPVHDPVSGRVIGLIDLSSHWKLADPRSLELVTTAARTMEQCLLDARRDRDARLLRRYSDLASRSTDLLVDSDGYVLAADESMHPKPLDVPEGGGEIILNEGSVAVVEPLGQGEAYLIRRPTPRGAKAAPAESLERTEERARELAAEQAALRKVATLVAHEPSPDRLFALVTEQVARVFDVPLVRLVRYEPDGMAVVGAFSQGDEEPFPMGSRWPLDTPGLAATVRKTGRPARVDDYELIPGPIAASVREAGMRSAVGSPIVVEGGLWGAMMVLSSRRESLPEDTETRLTDFTELVATAISNAEDRRELHRFAAEQGALRRAATLVASGAPPTEVFAAITTSASELFDAPFASLLRFGPDERATMVAGCPGCSPYVGRTWTVPADDPGIVRTVVRSGRPSRIEDHSRVYGPVGEAARALGVGSVIGAPVIVDGSVWGVLAVGAALNGPPLAPDAADRLANFADLVSTAIVNTEAHDQVRRYLDEQAALRRVATLVARGVSPAEIFSAVTHEVGGLLGSEAAIARFEPDGSAMVVVGVTEGIPVVSIGTRWPLEDFLASTAVYRTGRPARNDHTGHRNASGTVADSLRKMDYVSTVAAPIVVEGNLWGVMTVSDRRERLPPDTEERVARFGELVATAIANAGSRSALADSEARKRAVMDWALDCIVTIDHEGKILEFNPAAEATFGFRREDVLGKGMAELIIPPSLREEHYRGLERYLETGEGPILRKRLELNGLRSDGTEFPVELTISRITVADLPMFTAYMRDITDRKRGEEERARLLRGESAARAEAEAASERAQDLAREQAALRRVATLVAEAAKPEQVLAAVAQEVAEVFGVELVTVCSYESDAILVLSSVGVPAFPAGSYWPLDVPSLPRTIHATGRAARIDDFSGASGLDASAREAGVRAAVGVPIVVEGSVWGSINIATTENSPLQPDAEERLGRFTDLVATSVSNATMRGELAASRARVIAAADETRRRIERDLHDGAQQQLVTLAVALRRTEAKFPGELDELRAEVSRVADGLTGAVEELREMSRGIHPAILSEGGLSPALKALGRRSDVRVKLDVRYEGRLPEQVEVAAYYIVSEALTNASKHAHAAHVWVSLRVEDDWLRLSIRDDGVGGADPRRGSGLIGLKDRIEALGGTKKLESPSGRGTRIEVEIPIASNQTVDSPSPSHQTA